MGFTNPTTENNSSFVNNTKGSNSAFSNTTTNSNSSFSNNTKNALDPLWSLYIYPWRLDSPWTYNS